MKREEVNRRNRGLTDEQIREAVRLYEAGLSLARVGVIIGASARTVQLRLRQHGVATRDAHRKEV